MATDNAQRRLIRLPEVCNMVGLSRSVIYSRIKNHMFPPPIKLGYSSGWIEEEIQMWIEQQIHATRSKPYQRGQMGHV